MILDSETVGLKPMDLIFDLGYVIATKTEIIVERQFLVKEILTSPIRMRKAFAWDKIFSFYIPQIDSGNLKLFNWLDIIEQFRTDFADHKIDVFTTYNLPFDRDAMMRTNTLLGDRYKIMPHKPDLLDLWLFACTTILNTAIYHEFAEEMGWVTEAGNVSTKAENAIAYMTGNFNFKTKHTALKDAQLETELLQYLLRKKKKIPYNIIDVKPWEYAQITKDKMI
jgi:hypothetical protein